MNRIQLTLTPDWDGEKIAHVSVDIEAQIHSLEKESLFFTNDRTIFKPFTELLEPVTVRDELGILPCEETTEQMGYILLRSYTPERETKGTVKIHYSLTLAPCGRNPVFDLGYEKGGMTGSGMTFLPGFAKGKYRYWINWNLSALPQGCSGVSSFGIGTVEQDGDEGLLAQMFYAAGELDFVKQDRFTYCWFHNPLLLEQALPIAKIFAYEQEFFRDTEAVYTIIARHTDDDCPRAGGTALTRSYSFLYKNDEQLDGTWLKFLFAHEMVHNWIHAADEPFGTCTWYVEGMAEYYSMLLPWRMGAVTRDEVLWQLNKRAGEYYENPKLHVSNAELGTQLMADPEMTRMPYGRGYFYLCHADAMIRKATDGQHNLDDVTLRMMERDEKLHKEQGGHVGNEDWLEFYGAYVGKEKAEEEYGILQSGEAVWEMELDCLNAVGGEFAVEKLVGEQRQTKEACDLWQAK